jgi:Ca2+-binding EF-hand superfamily protein
VVGPKFTQKHSSKEIEDTFNFFDEDMSGFISTSELREAFQKMGKHFSDKEFREMIKSVDKDGDRKISLEEFTKLLNNA